MPNPGDADNLIRARSELLDALDALGAHRDPIVAGSGSDVLFHVDNGSVTTGCVNVSQADLDQFLAG